MGLIEQGIHWLQELSPAGVLALMGAKNVKRGVPPTPEETIESVREDVEWTKQRVKEGRR